jgi:hypothetical protein
MVISQLFLSLGFLLQQLLCLLFFFGFSATTSTFFSVSFMVSSAATLIGSTLGSNTFSCVMALSSVFLVEMASLTAGSAFLISSGSVFFAISIAGFALSLSFLMGSAFTSSSFFCSISFFEGSFVFGVSFFGSSFWASLLAACSSACPIHFASFLLIFFASVPFLVSTLGEAVFLFFDSSFGFIKISLL